MKDSFGIDKSFKDWESYDWPGNPDKDVVDHAVVKTFSKGLIKVNVWIYYAVYFECYMGCVSNTPDSPYSRGLGFPDEIKNDLMKCKEFVDSDLLSIFR